MATKYARAAGGNWSADATWSTTSGGAADTTAPGASDDAVIDANSGAVTAANGSVQSLTITNGAVKTTALTVSGTLAISGALSITGNSAVNRILINSTTLGTARQISAGSVSLTNVDFRDITAAGAAAPFTGTSIGNCGGNTSITADTPIDCYRVGAGGNWSDSAWFTTSGGATPARVPLPQDTALVDGNATGTITNDMPRMCANLNCTGFAGTLNIAPDAGTDIHGNITLASGMTLTQSGAIYARSRTTAYLTSAGNQFTKGFAVGAAATLTLADAFSSASSFTVRQGTFDSAGFSITASSWDSQIDGTPYANVTLSSSTVTLTSTSALAVWNCNSVHTVSAASASIVYVGNTTTARTFAGGGKTYGTLTDTNTSSGTLSITGANTFANINKTAVAACTLALPTSSGITITGLFNVTGASGAVLTLTGDVTKAEGTVSCDYLTISSSDATGGATFYAGANSTDGGSNTGWIFGAPSGLTSPYQGGSYVGGALNTRPVVDGALVVT